MHQNSLLHFYYTSDSQQDTAQTKNYIRTNPHSKLQLSNYHSQQQPNPKYRMHQTENKILIQNFLTSNQTEQYTFQNQDKKMPLKFISQKQSIVQVKRSENQQANFQQQKEQILVSKGRRSKFSNLYFQIDESSYENEKSQDNDENNIEPNFLPHFSERQTNVENMKGAENEQILSTVIFVNKRIKNLFTPQFDMYLNGSNEHILSGKKVLTCTTSNYRMSKDLDDFSSQTNYMGKVRSTNQEGLYNILDQGVNPQYFFTESKLKKKRRSILASIVVQKREQYLKISVYVLKENYNYFDMLSYPSQESSLQKLYEKHEDKIYFFRSKQMQWIPRLNYVCQKNFTLIDPTTKRQIIFFAKKGQDAYALDISSRISPKIAFGIVLSIFNYCQ